VKQETLDPHGVLLLHPAEELVDVDLDFGVLAHLLALEHRVEHQVHQGVELERVQQGLLQFEQVLECVQDGLVGFVGVDVHEQLQQLHRVGEVLLGVLRQREHLGHVQVDLGQTLAVEFFLQFLQVEFI